MGSGYWKMVMRGLKGSFSRLMAIFAIVALGVGVLSGMLATTPDMLYSVDRYYDDTETMDIRLVSTLGFAESDPEALRQVEGVEKVMPIYSADLLFVTSANDTMVTRLQSLPGEGKDYLNQPQLIEGRMPERAGECVVETGGLLSSGLAVGDTLTLAPENTDPEDKVSQQEFTIVGLVESAYYFSVERDTTNVGSGKIQLIAYTTEDSFSYEVYTDIFLTVSGAREETAFSDSYDEVVDRVTDRLEGIEGERAEVRYEEIRASADEELDKAQQEYDEKKAEAEQELADAQAELENGRQELADGEQAIQEAQQTLSDSEQEIADGWAQLEEGRQELEEQTALFEQTVAEKRQEITDGWTQLEDGEEQLRDAKAQLDAAKAQLDSAKAQIDENAPLIEALRPLAPYNPAIAQQVEAFDQAVAQYEQGLAQYEQGLQEYYTGLAQLESSRSQLTQGEAELESTAAQTQQQLRDAQAELDRSEQQLRDAEQELEEGRQTLAQNQRELEDARTELADGEAQYQEAKAEAEQKLEDAQRELDDARAEVESMDRPEWYILDRHANLGYESFYSNAQKIEAIAKVFPWIFFLVAALVSLTTMTRMVEEERVHIGTMKALGFEGFSSIMKYLLYALVFTLGGSVVGVAFGTVVFPTVIWNAYRMMYNLPQLLLPFHWEYALLSSGAALVCTLAATGNVCYQSVREQPAQLMQPKAPKAGKRILLERIPFLWKRLSFLHKVTARNIFRYKKRFFMTVIGVAGCTALLVTGFGLRDSIGDIIGKQYDEIFLYNLTVGLKGDETPDLSGDTGLGQILNDTDRVEKYTLFHQETVTVSAESSGEPGQESITLMVPQNESDLREYLNLRERRSQKTIDFDANSAVLSEKLAERLSLEVGDSFTVENSDGETAQFTLTGIAENYLTGFVVLSPENFAQGFGADAITWTTVYGVVPNADQALRDDMTAQILQLDGIASVSFAESVRETFTDFLDKINYIVVVLILCAGILAFVVLYNLTNINITERVREIATIKVLGFYDKEVYAYVFRETLVLSAIGALAGLGLGKLLHAFVVRTAEVDMIMFGRDIYLWSYLLSIAITMVFSILVCLGMMRRLRRVNMVESLKSVE